MRVIASRPHRASSRAGAPLRGLFAAGPGDFPVAVTSILDVFPLRLNTLKAVVVQSCPSVDPPAGFRVDLRFLGLGSTRGQSWVLSRSYPLSPSP